MNEFEITQTLATRPRFTVFEAFSKTLQFIVVLKQCEYSSDSEAEFFIRSALMKTKNNSYLQPLLSIFADVEQTTKKQFIIFVWKKGETLDIEVEQDIASRFPSGRAGYGKFRTIAINSTTGEAVERVRCLTLDQIVARKVSKVLYMTNLNLIFKETLAYAKCTHPNICEFLDFRLFQNSKGWHCAYIVMEKLQQDLNMEIENRKLQLYEETELRKILHDVTAGLLHAKSLSLAHRDIKPANILRGPRGVKLTDFGSIWLKGMASLTPSVAGTEVYMSPEAINTMGNPELLYRPFESDVFSLGMTMLHLASLKLPNRQRRMTKRELEALLQREMQELRYSVEFKRLLGTMLSIEPHERPTLECVAEFCTPKSKEQANSLSKQGDSKYYDGAYSKAAEMYGAAHAIYSLFLNDKRTAKNLINWGAALAQMGRSEEAVAKYQEAQTIYSQFPNDKHAALNLMHWGVALAQMGRSEGAAAKYQEAQTIFSQFPNDKRAALNLMHWGVALAQMGRSEEALAKYQEAQAIYSRYPNDKHTAENLSIWGVALTNMGRNKEAIDKFQEAQTTYSRFPNDKDTALNLMNWGIALGNMKRNEEAVGKYQEAQAIYSRFPSDKHAAFSLRNWGAALRNMGNIDEALVKYQEAQAIYSRLPSDKDTAFNLMHWGATFGELGKNEEAVAKFQEAQAIYSRFPNDKRTAFNLMDWGLALTHMGRSEEAVDKYQEAQAIYSRFPNDRHTARNLMNWGAALTQVGRSKEAVSKFQEAQVIYSRFPNDKYAARNLRNWGVALTQMRRCEEAVDKFQEAQAIYSRLPNNKDTAENLRNWGAALENMKRGKEAIINYQEASKIYNSLGDISRAELCEQLISKLGKRHSNSCSLF